MYIKTQKDIKVISRGELWSYYFNLFKNETRESMRVIYISQLRFLDEDRFMYYKNKGKIK